MIKIEHTEVFGFEAAIRGMRNPKNSWDKSDSGTCGGEKHIGCIHCAFAGEEEHNEEMLKTEAKHGYGIKPCGKREFDGDYCIGHNDLKLMKNLSMAGNDHAKYLRMINVTCDITAPLYWWKEFDTYKVGTVANSCSTMHKIHAKEFTLEDFSHEHVTTRSLDILLSTIKYLNECRDLYVNYESHDNSGYTKPTKKEVWWQMIQLLPSSYNQKRTAQLNYQVLKNMYGSRKNHKLDEWRQFCEWIETLPYFKELILRDTSMDAYFLKTKIIKIASGTEDELKNVIERNSMADVFVAHLRCKYAYEDKWEYITESCMLEGQHGILWFGDWWEGQENVEYLSVMVVE